MKVRVLGCSGAIAKDCRTTSFLIDGEVLIDAGTGVGDLTLDEMRRVDHVLLTHSHLDHVAALPLMVDAIASQRTAPLQIHALAGTIDALKAQAESEVKTLQARIDPATETFEKIAIRPKKTNISIKMFSLVWRPKG